MRGFKKHIEVFQEEKFREIDFGTVFYVAGTATAALNKYVKRYARRLSRHVNEGEGNWVTCKIVYLDEDNSYFASKPEACFYSAMLPTLDEESSGYSFLVATLQNCDEDLIDLAFERYFSTLQEMFDEILDTGKYKSFHLRFKEDLTPNGELFVCFLAESESPICGLPEQQRKHVSRRELSQLEITNDWKHRILLKDYNKELHFSAQVKALYVLFLLHPAGIRMKEIGNYKDQYLYLYNHFTNRSDPEKSRESVERLFDVFSPNALNVKKSQCSEELKRAIPEDSIRRYYEIEVNRGHPHVIRLDRSLVKIPDSLLKQKHL